MSQRSSPGILVAVDVVLVLLTVLDLAHVYVARTPKKITGPQYARGKCLYAVIMCLAKHRDNVLGQAPGQCASLVLSAVLS